MEHGFVISAADLSAHMPPDAFLVGLQVSPPGPLPRSRGLREEGPTSYSTPGSATGAPGG